MIFYRRIYPIFLAILIVFFAAVVSAAEPAEGETDALERATESREEGLSSEERLMEAAASIARQVGEIRQLELLESIDKGVQNREQLRAMLIERFNEEVSDQDFEAEAQVYKRLGLFEEDLDYRQLMLDLLTEQIAGFYDQGTKELYIMEGLPGPVQRPAMAHEIFHAVQDQHFDIGRLLETFSAQENGDFALSRMALIEGDATVVMIDYELYEQGVLPQNFARSIADIPELAAVVMQMDLDAMSAAEQLTPPPPGFGGDSVPSLTDSVLGNAPRIVRDVLLFPYLGGMRFVLRVRAGRSWAEFNQVYQNPPVSTSQILHPERYIAGEMPVEIRFDISQALPDYEAVYESVFGELQIRSWLDTHLERMEEDLSSEEIAAGWDGDRLRGYRGPDEEMLVVHMSSWRSVEEAQAFAQALEATARHRHEVSGSYQSGEYGESWCLRPGTEAQGERIYVERWGDMVLYIEGAPSTLDEQGRELDAALYLIRDAAWETHRRVHFEEVLIQREGQKPRAIEADQ